MKKESKVVRLNHQEQNIIEMLREKGTSPLSEELKNLIRLQQHSDIQLETSAIKGLISLLEDKKRIFDLNMHEQGGFISVEQSKQLKMAIEENQNILIVGGIGTGKTTLLRALLDYQTTHFPGRRILTIEKFPEIKEDCLSNPQILYRTNDNVSMKDFSFLKENDAPKLVIGEFSMTEHIFSMVTAFSVGSSVLATIHGGDWKTRLSLFGAVMPIHKTLIVVLSKRKIANIYEDTIGGM